MSITSAIPKCFSLSRRRLWCSLSLALAAGAAHAQYAETDLHDFNAGGPQAGVSFDAAGNMYGTTRGDGLYGYGTVWEMTPSGAFLDLHDFGLGTDGNNVYAGVTIDAAGNLYGTTFGGGANGAGMVWKLTPSGAYSDLHDFWFDPNGYCPYGGVIVDAAGNLYGGTSYAGCIYELTATGDFLNLQIFDQATGFCPTGEMVLDSGGNLFGTTTQGGANFDGAVWELTPSGSYLILHAFAAGEQAGLNTGGVTLDRPLARARLPL